jgi:hypothetical protein
VSNRLGMGMAVGVAGLLVGAVVVASCSGETPPPPKPAPPPPVAPAPPPAPKVAPPGPLATLIMVQSQSVNGKPGPAKMTLLRTDGTDWYPEVIEDPDSNVFHKGMPWKDGILTIGAEKAMLKFWQRDGAKWKSTTLFEKSWGGKFDRLRDVEVGDVDNDGQDEIVLVTHDRGVVAVGEQGADATWTWTEMDQKDDTFVHEVEIGDVDGDGKKEFYTTPSARNRASGASQPGGVARYDARGGKYVRTDVFAWEESHAKEILVVDTDADGKDELYVAREGHVVKEGDKPVLKSPAAIVRAEPVNGGKKWVEVPVASLENEKQCRFLVPGDVDGDGKIELVAAGMDTGLWLLDDAGAGQWKLSQIEADTGGFEHATDVADLNGDGKLEVYAASEKKGTRVLRRYTLVDGAWKKEDVVPIPKLHITWNLQDARL